ncbi:hypothetical protein [Aliikangiella sp. IMCC44359]|uniref:hypothetical protein n=1 Tax=Aliikangiella sp. IMCC44359 TaxID=3459125 RepID=UPI00403B388E
MNYFFSQLLFIVGFCFCLSISAETRSPVEIVVLGIAQDAGYPQLNCYKPHCVAGWKDVSKRRLATSWGELPNRNMSEVPHPFVKESMQLFSSLPRQDKQKVIFIHFNHTNPLLTVGSKSQKVVKTAGFRVASEGMHIGL